MRSPAARSWGPILLAVALLAPLRAADAADASLVRADLVAERSALVPGEDNWIALRLRMPDAWHVYWKNPGDSGLPPTLEWRVPDGVGVSAIEWPVPERIVVGPLASFGYEHEVRLPVNVAVAAPLAPGDQVRLAATATWLVCKVDCIPEEAELTLDLPVRAGPVPLGPDADGIRAALAAVPRAIPGWQASVTPAGDGTLVLHAAPAPGFVAADYGYEFFPDEGGVVEPAAAQTASVGADGIRLALREAATRTAPVERLRGVLVATAKTGDVPPIAVALDTGAAAATPTPPAAAPVVGLVGAVGFAFLGGLILNLMPCVFPVLAIKVMSFTQHAAAGRRSALVHAGLFAAGILVSFWALAGGLLALRAGGAEIGWGFQLQSPAVVLGLAFLFLVLALVLLGVLDVGGRLTTAAGGVQLPGGRAGSFASGVLATAVATPCTAPFMGVALGWALVAPAAAAFAVFTALAAGMGLPYVVLAASPAAARLLPRPGPWMETLEQALAFPLLATVVWLLWVLGRQAGPDAQALALGGMVLAALGCWLAGRFATPLASTATRRLAAATAVALVVGGYLLALPSGTAPRAIATTAGDHGMAWEAYAPARLAALRAAGHPVYLDVTAAWCLTCQVNERVVFSSEAVRDAFRRHDVVAMRADWTSRDPVITRTLASFGRSGVPLNVLYPADPAAAPLVQPTILTPSIVLDALEGAGRSHKEITS